MVSQESVIELYRDIGQDVNKEIIDHIYYLACDHFGDKYIYPLEEMSFEDFLTMAKLKTEDEFQLDMAKRNSKKD